MSNDRATSTERGISVVVPAYQAETNLGETLEPPLAQSHREWEAIVVDDGSDDRTAEIAAGFGRRDQRLRLLRAPHQGVS